MKEYYDRYETRYKCTRCATPINVESDRFYWFSDPEDPLFWCPVCEDFPNAELAGTPAANLPTQLQLPKGFVCRTVPMAKPGEVAQWNVLYRPYSKRSFLRQYADWVKLGGIETCHVSSSCVVFAQFDRETQQYTDEVANEVSDLCLDRPCQFLQSRSLKADEPECPMIKHLCDTKGKHGLCQTGDEAMILQWYLIITGAEHFPMLIPQVSILKGKRRPDFISFVPLSKFQYEQVVVLVDRPGKDPVVMERESLDYQEAGYRAKRIEIKPVSNSYFKIARELAIWIETLARCGMTDAY